MFYPFVHVSISIGKVITMLSVSKKRIVLYLKVVIHFVCIITKDIAEWQGNYMIIGMLSQNLLKNLAFAVSCKPLKVYLFSAEILELDINIIIN